MARPATAPRRGPPADVFRSQIAAAEADGVRRDDMTLRLTLSDVTALKRDRDLPVADISFAGGVSEPQLHFEVRYRSNPQEKYRAVDPALVLPK